MLVEKKHTVIDGIRLSEKGQIFTRDSNLTYLYDWRLALKTRGRELQRDIGEQN